MQSSMIATAQEVFRLPIYSMTHIYILYRAEVTRNTQKTVFDIVLPKVPHCPCRSEYQLAYKIMIYNVTAVQGMLAKYAHMHGLMIQLIH